MQGSGVYTWSDGTRYEGEFENDKANGSGSMPSYVDAWNDLGVQLQRENKLNEAIVNSEKQIKITPNHEWAWYNLGQNLQLQGKIDEALLAFQKQVEVNPKHQAAWYHIGNILQQQQRIDEAIAAYRNKLK